ncbi:unnamed protein product [Porites evermanni]|uniref:Uncharacterized protein n=1 Tax=Porites evermanni TaxID=104178 RepID=A0ABN8SSU4_9CNID|nr:unnamed protein product [Porites evermanni]
MMMAITCTLCPLARDYTGLILYAVGFGMFDGCFILLITITTCDLVGPESVYFRDNRLIQGRFLCCRRCHSCWILHSFSNWTGISVRSERKRTNLRRVRERK